MSERQMIAISSTRLAAVSARRLPLPHCPTQSRRRACFARQPRFEAVTGALRLVVPPGCRIGPPGCIGQRLIFRFLSGKSGNQAVPEADSSRRRLRPLTRCPLRCQHWRLRSRSHHPTASRGFRACRHHGARCSSCDQAVSRGLPVARMPRARPAWVHG